MPKRLKPRIGLANSTGTRIHQSAQPGQTGLPGKSHDNARSITYLIEQEELRFAAENDNGLLHEAFSHRSLGDSARHPRGLA
jgi:hypothetical protein